MDRASRRRDVHLCEYSSCVFKFPLREYFLPQWEQAERFSPVCWRWWIVRFHLDALVYGQKAHQCECACVSLSDLHEKNVYHNESMWTLIWTLRCDGNGNTLSHTLHWCFFCADVVVVDDEGKFSSKARLRCSSVSTASDGLDGFCCDIAIDWSIYIDASSLFCTPRLNVPGLGVWKMLILSENSFWFRFWTHLA